MRRAFLRVAALGAVALTAVLPAAATSIVRTDLKGLAKGNAHIVEGEVLDV